jgi:GNAT superfamily N-acetyltransferase
MITMNCKGPKKEIAEFHDLGGDEIPEIEKLALTLYQEDPPGRKMSRLKIRRTIKELSEHPDKGAITVIYVGTLIIGYAIIIYFWSNEYGGNIAYLDEFYIKPSWRSKGIGSSYLKHVAKTRGLNLKGIHVELTPANKKAFAFYSQHGFKMADNYHMFKAIR